MGKTGMAAQVPKPLFTTQNAKVGLLHRTSARSDRNHKSEERAQGTAQQRQEIDGEV